MVVINNLMEKIEKGIIISIVLSVLVYALFFFWSDFGEIINAFKQVGLMIIIVLLCLSLLNYILRFIRWHLLLTNAKVKIKLLDSLKCFLSGLCLTITPGKAGELFKASFVKKYTNASRLKVLPIVVLERVFDLTGFAVILLLSLLFVSFDDYKSLSMSLGVGVLVLIFSVFLFLRTKTCQVLVKKLVKKFRFLQDKKRVIFEVLDDYSNFSIKSLTFLIFLSFFGWFLEVFALNLLLNVFNITPGLFSAGFVFGFSSLIGLVFFTPGGIGGFEGTSYSLIVNLFQASPSVATVITLIIRLTTLWFAVLIGLVTYLKFLKK